MTHALRRTCLWAIFAAVFSLYGPLARAQHPTTGPCCVVTASGVPVCVQLTPANCQTVSGQFGGVGRSCNAPGACPTGPTGACCVAFGTPRQGWSVRCLLADEYQCLVQGGVFAGAGTSCQNYVCPIPPPPTGACCINGLCQQLTQADCRRQRGLYRGDATNCATTACPGAPTGACCIPVTNPHGGTQNRCHPLDQVTCASLGGTYGGNGTSCTGYVCPVPPTPTGACCINGLCQQLTQADCGRQRGLYRGDSTACATTACPGAPTGACCIPVTNPHGGTVLRCQPLDQVTCAQRGGVYGGNGTVCTGYVCPPPPPTTGACCVASSGGGFGCVVMTPAMCTTLNGVFGGLGSTCATLPCPPVACLCDWNGDGVVDAADEAAFLIDFAAGTADVDGDGDTDQDDWNAFYACFHAGGC